MWQNVWKSLQQRKADVQYSFIRQNLYVTTIGLRDFREKFFFFFLCFIFKTCFFAVNLCVCLAKVLCTVNNTKYYHTSPSTRTGVTFIASPRPNARWLKPRYLHKTTIGFSPCFSQCSRRYPLITGIFN